MYKRCQVYSGAFCVLSGQKSRGWWSRDSILYSCWYNRHIIDEQFEARKPVYVEISIAGSKYTGSGYIVDYPIEMPLDSAVSYSLSIAGASKLTKTKTQ